MFSEIFASASFELKQRYRSLSSYVYFLLFFSMSVLMALAAGGAFKGVVISFGGGSRVLVNSSLSTATYLSFLSSFAMFIIAPVFGQAVVKDFANHMDQIIFTTPMRVSHFLAGRFIGAFIFLLIILSSVPLGIYFASLLPLIQSSMLGPNALINYLAPLFFVAIPNIFILGSIFFLVGSRTKKMTGIYVSTTILFLLWSLSGQLLRDVDNKMLASLVDPIALTALSQTIQYWSVHQQNTQILTFESFYLWNRLFWTGVALIALLYAIFGFNWQMKGSKRKIRKNPKVVKSPHLGELDTKITRSHSPFLAQLIRQIRFEFSQTVKSIYFLVIVLAGVGYMMLSGTQVGKMYGTVTYPVTYNILGFVGGTFSLFILVLITIYTGETVWRERDLKINQIIDSLPFQTSVQFVAKFINIILITLLLLTTILISGVLIQLFYGYTNFELDQYIVHLYFKNFPSYINLISLTFFIHVVSRNKYLAHALVILFYLFDLFSEGLGFEHYLYKFNSKPPVTYSDMNGFGHVFGIYHIYNTYWLFLSVILMSVAYLYWQRGVDLRKRQSFTAPLKTVCAVSLIGFLSTGAYLFYQTNIVNEYLSKRASEQIEADYETKYKGREFDPQAEMTSVKAVVNLFPKELKMNAHLDIVLTNQSDKDVTEIFLNLSEKEYDIKFSAPGKLIKDEPLKVALFRLDSPLQPGKSLNATYKVSVDHSNISHGSNLRSIYHNGTFFNNLEFFPLIGYSETREITSTKTRAKYGLKEKRRKASIDDQRYFKRPYFGNFGTWIDFEAVVSTDEDQIAIAPGYLEKEWVDQGRRHFHYKMDQKILNFYAFVSAKYEVKKEVYKGVSVEVYYHKGHPYNVDRMIESTKKALDYFNENFGPYQHRQYRILEFPRYRNFAQSFPNTIPFSEGVGFIAKVNPNDPEDIDYPFYINAHELAHQWWAHQLIGADVQGSEMLSESFSQYSSLMVMEKTYGREKMKRFLKYELEGYLFGRGQESEYENPLYLTEGQSYTHYKKGSLSFYALKEYVGEDVVNSAMRETLTRFGLKRPPYPTSKDFLKVLKSKVKPEEIPLVEDLFEKIVLFENLPVEATSRKIADDNFEISLKVNAQKIYSDKNGKESKAEFQQMMEIGVLNKENEYIYLKKHLVRSGENKFIINVNEQPSMAGVDPRNILIDRNPSDNLLKVTTN